MHFSGGVKPEDKVYIEKQIEVVKIDTVKAVKVDTLVIKKAE